MCTEVCPLAPFPFLFRYSPYSVESLCSQANFEFVIHDGYDGGWDYKLAATRSSFNTVYVLRGGMEGKQGRKADKTN